MKVLHTADWHLGSFRGPEENGVNLRSEDTIRCLEEMLQVARKEKPELVLVAGDIFDKAEVWQGRSHREVLQARRIILELSRIAQKVIVMRGTPNHDSAEAFEELQAHFELVENVDIITTPQVISWNDFSIAVLPGFDRGVFRAKHPGLSKEDENQVFTEELSNIILGLRAQCDISKKSILMAHYTVPGCNAESGQTMMLTQFEPIIPQETLLAANFDLVALGHIHRPQRLGDHDWYYSGAINAMNFNDEGQPRGFWIHYFESGAFGSIGPAFTDSQFFLTPIREFATLNFTDADITAINQGHIDDVAMNRWRHDGSISGKIVRIHYSCTYENKKALNKALLEKTLLDDGAFMVWEILPEKIGAYADRTDMSGTSDPEHNLWRYLEEKGYPEVQIQDLIAKARPIIAEAEASTATMAAAGTFEPVEIEVKNYRNYEEERFSFEDISFCTINGQNGAGKSSLFMDAIVDCLFEEPREGDLTGWIRNDEKARSGSIMFSFRIGKKLYRVTRTRARSGKGTLNIAEWIDGDWADRSKEKYKDTQTEIINILGMDSLTFKSCALIMQDKYGLFLEASKEERMVILGNLLGLGIYQAMEKTAWEKAKVYGAKTRELKQEISIYTDTINACGNPEGEIERLQRELQEKSCKANACKDERDIKAARLLSMNEASGRCKKFDIEVRSLEAKALETDSSRHAYKDTVQACEAILGKGQEIMEKCSRYRTLEERKKQLIEGKALYESKMLTVSKYDAEISALEEELGKLTRKAEADQERLSKCENSAEDAETLRKAAEYTERKSELDKMQELALSYQAADRKVQEAQAMRADKKKQMDALAENLELARSYLGRKIGILSESGCIDIKNADCRFIQDAKAAQEELDQRTADYRSECEGLQEQIDLWDMEIASLKQERDNIPFDSERKKTVEKICEELQPYVLSAELIRKKENEIALLKASMKHVRSNISELNKRLSMVTSERDRAYSELNEYRAYFEEDASVTEEMKNLAGFLEKERQIPVVQEKLSNAKQRITELDQQADEIQKQITAKKEDLEQEAKKCADLLPAQAEVKEIEEGIAALDDEISRLQIEIGGWKQKAEQIQKLKDDIASLQKAEMIAAGMTASYDTLKAAFSQDGIPHQIVRSIIPQLTATANNILGQMTGGRMGIEFRTEKVLKSNSKREIVTLDIFIEEYGKSSLPYLSKSGGEKVKASLSVILALAEIKSSSAGVQLGMLFIDEPPFLDGEGIQAYCDALETIQSRYRNIKIMAITHDPTMKARFPQNLDIIKTDHGSKVIY